MLSWRACSSKARSKDERSFWKAGPCAGRGADGGRRMGGCIATPFRSDPGRGRRRHARQGARNAQRSARGKASFQVQTTAWAAPVPFEALAALRASPPACSAPRCRFPLPPFRRGGAAAAPPGVPRALLRRIAPSAAASRALSAATSSPSARRVRKLAWTSCDAMEEPVAACCAPRRSTEPRC